MDAREARTVLTEQLFPYRGEGYKALQRLLAEADIFEIQGPSGAAYRIQVEAVWMTGPAAIGESSACSRTARPSAPSRR